MKRTPPKKKLTDKQLVDKYKVKAETKAISKTKEILRQSVSEVSKDKKAAGQ